MNAEFTFGPAARSEIDRKEHCELRPKIIACDAQSHFVHVQIARSDHRHQVSQIHRHELDSWRRSSTLTKQNN